MEKIFGYMLTWTTYGTWLQGDERGFVKNGQILPGNKGLEKFNSEIQKYEAVKLNSQQQKVVEQGIVEKADTIGQKIFALAVCSNHVHIVLENIIEPVGKIASCYKNAGRMALRTGGFNKRLWTRGFDKRFCFNINDLNRRTQYVIKHENSISPGV